jgi:hypothetical protein
MVGKEDRNYKCIQRFLEKTSPQETLLRLFQESASFVIGDPTEMPRPQAKKTDYVGTLSDGQTSGYWLLFLSTAFHGRSIPCGFVSYSSKTINQESTSRNRHHFEVFAKVKEMIGDRPLVLDREFSYLELMENLVFEGLNFVIRLKVGPKFTDQEGNIIALTVSKGETRIINKVFLHGQGICQSDRGLERRFQPTDVGDDQSQSRRWSGHLFATHEDRRELSRSEKLVRHGKVDVETSRSHGEDGGASFDCIHDRALVR